VASRRVRHQSPYKDKRKHQVFDYFDAIGQKLSEPCLGGIEIDALAGAVPCQTQGITAHGPKRFTNRTGSRKQYPRDFWRLDHPSRMRLEGLTGIVIDWRQTARATRWLRGLLADLGRRKEEKSYPWLLARNGRNIQTTSFGGSTSPPKKTFLARLTGPGCALEFGGWALDGEAIES